MKIATLDFETFWSQDHSLTKMLPLSYVMHPETEIISCSIKMDDADTDVYFGEARVRSALEQIDWSDAMALGHNMSAFDAMILAWRFGIRPKMWGCTLAMARPIHAITVGNSLAKLVQHYALGVKDNAALLNTKGKHLKDFTTDELRDMARYNKADTDQCYALFKKLKPHYTAAEMWQIDATIRMLTEPAFNVDTELLRDALVKERNRKTTALLQLAELLDMDIDGDTSKVEDEVRVQLLSAAKFSDILTQRNVPIPMKPSPTNPDKEVPALAKTDQEFLDLQESDDTVVAAAARARLAVKSTLLETRIEAFLEASAATQGRLPVTLNYCGATTTGRWSGWAYNPQNLPRVSGKLSDALRNCMVAPAGHDVVVADLSGIELRVNMFLWKVPYAMELFKAPPDKADLYRYFAAHDLYNIEESEVSKVQRQVGKVAHLGLGFGAGGATFQKVAKMMGGVDMTLDEAKDVVFKYRDAHVEIARGWRTCHDSLMDIYEGNERAIDPWGLCITCEHGIRLPSGRIIRYPKLHMESDTKGNNEWWYGEGRHRARIYAGKVTENMVQALARDAMADYTLQFFMETGYRPALLVHDEWVGVLRDSKAQDGLDTLQKIMRTPLKWWPELVTWSEGDIAPSYGAAK
jgi:DNA polymerase I-like protein with 3'-5' exonuclease and polymerase domains